MTRSHQMSVGQVISIISFLAQPLQYIEYITYNRSEGPENKQEIAVKWKLNIKPPVRKNSDWFFYV